MFGIGLPEMIVICAVALIVVGPDKLPDLARSLAKGVMEMKKTMNQLKESLTEEEDVLGEVKKELHDTAKDIQQHVLDSETRTWNKPLLEEQPRNVEAEEDQVIEMRPWEEETAAQADKATAGAPDPADDISPKDDPKAASTDR